MATIHMSHSSLIDAPKEKIYKVLMHLQESAKWFPWLAIDADAKVAFSQKQGEIGSGISWEGELSGNGQIKLRQIDDADIEMDIYFFKPFNFSITSLYTLQEHEGKTEVIWHMKGSLPWYLYFMRKKLQRLVQMDLERGLGMLKEYVEDEKVTSSCHIEGVVEMQANKYVAISNTCAIEEVGDVMKKDYEKLFDFIAENEITLEKMPFSIYNTFNLSKNETTFISCIPYDGEIKLPNGFIYGEIVPQKAIKVVHTGTYKHLANGWMAARTYARIKRIKTTTSIIGMEFYPNDPDNTPPEELTTEIYLPLG